MPIARDYFTSLSEMITGEELPLALEHIAILYKSITPARKQELENAISLQEKKKLLDAWFGGYIADPVKNFAALIGEAREWNALAELAKMTKTEGRKEARVTTAKPLPDSLKKLLRDELAQFAEAEHITFIEEKNLIGGIKIQMGNREIDYSIKNRLTEFLN